MPMSEIKARDCLPFENENDKVIRQLCEYFASTDYSKDDDERIASLRTSLCVVGDGQPATIQTRWWAGRYIGLAKIAIPRGTGFSWFDISIRPRFGEQFLLSIIDDVYNIKIGTHDGESKAEYSTEWFSALLNLLRRRMWVDKCSKANRYGLPRTNIKREHQGAVMHGAIDVRRTIMPWLMKKEVATHTYEKTLDDTICRIVYEAHRVLSKKVITNRKKKKKDSNAIGFGFSMPPTVQDTINTLNSQYKGTVFDLTENDFKRIRYKSIYVSWKPLVDFSWAVIREKELGYKSANNMSECVFVDMAEIWESFLRKKLGEGFADDGWRVLSVEECTYQIYKGKFYQRDIIPDIILEREQNGQKEYMVFDAKYKRMRGIKSSLKYSDVDRSDLFQIHTYIQYVQHNMGKVVVGGLLYPITQKGTNDDGTAFENTDIDLQSYHSFHLFGDENNETPPFIIDGILCPEVEDDKTVNEQNVKDSSRKMDENIKKMIGRIKESANL
jgi:5-methylcytosine-specific restriction endonuclease McrBC regulatory subunit McrC